MDDIEASRGRNTHDDVNKGNSAVLWLLRKIVAVCILVLEMVRFGSEYLIEIMIKWGYFGPDPEGDQVEKESEKVDLDDQPPAILAQIILEMIIGALVLPYILALFVPKILALSNPHSI